MPTIPRALSWDRHQGRASGYDVVALGFDTGLDEPRCALGLNRLRRLDDDNARRALIAAHYWSLLADVQGVAPVSAPPTGETLAHHLFTVVLAPGHDRDAVRAALAATVFRRASAIRRHIGSSLYPRDATRLPVTEESLAGRSRSPLSAYDRGADPTRRRRNRTGDRVKIADGDRCSGES